MLTEAEYPVVETSTRSWYALLRKNDINGQLEDTASTDIGWSLMKRECYPLMFEGARVVPAPALKFHGVYTRNDAPGFWIFLKASTHVIGFEDVDSAVMALRMMHT